MLGVRAWGNCRASWLHPESGGQSLTLSGFAHGISTFFSASPTPTARRLRGHLPVRETRPTAQPCRCGGSTAPTRGPLPRRRCLARRARYRNTTADLISHVLKLLRLRLPGLPPLKELFNRSTERGKLPSGTRLHGPGGIDVLDLGSIGSTGPGNLSRAQASRLRTTPRSALSAGEYRVTGARRGAARPLANGKN